MKSRPTFALVALFILRLSAIGSAQAPAPAPAVAELKARIDAKLAGAAVGGVHGVRIVSLASGEVLYSVNAEGVVFEKPVPGGDVNSALRLFLPASNMKLITTAAAVDQLGPDFTFSTVFAVRGGDLVVIGAGDPAFGDPAAGGGEHAAAAAEFARWAAQLKARGKIEFADLLIDDTVFDSEFVHPGWPRDQLTEWFCAPVGGLNLQTNCLEVKVVPDKNGGAPAVRLNPPVEGFRIVNQARTGGTANTLGLSFGRSESDFILRGTCAKATVEPINVAVRDPGMYFGRALLKALTDAGIHVRGGVKRAAVRGADGRLPGNLTVIAEHRTPLPIALARCNKKSQNMYAEAIFKTLGANFRAAGDDGPPTGSWARGSAAVERFLNKLHLPDEGRRIADGSGLSRENAVSPMLITEVLRHMHGHPQWGVYRDSLAIGGIDGTLARRLRDPGLKGNILAKTGYIRGVSALSGYIKTAGGEWLAFSMIFNDVKGAVNAAKDLEDDVCRELLRYGAPAAGAKATAPKTGAVPAAGKAIKR